MNRRLYAIASRLAGKVALDPNLHAEDQACTGLRSELSTPIRVEGDPALRIRRGDEGHSSDPYGGRAVPCVTPGGDLLGCEACGAPLAPSVGGDPSAFADPNFFLELFQSFAPGAGGSAAVQDMETAAVARVATEKRIPFIVFRGVSDGRGDPLMLPPIPYLQFVVYQQVAADNAAGRSRGLVSQTRIPVAAACSCRLPAALGRAATRAIRAPTRPSAGSRA